MPEVPKQPAIDENRVRLVLVQALDRIGAVVTRRVAEFAARGRNVSLKTILCYGDSNTWGAPPHGGRRFSADVRWAGVLRNTLGADYFVIEEGLGGRTTVWDDPIEGHKNGKTYLQPCLDSHTPLDLVIIMLGTNDLKKRFSLSPFDIAAGAGVLVDMVMNSKAGRDWQYAPAVLLICPPPTADLSKIAPEFSFFADMFEGAETKSQRLSVHYARVAQERGCHFLDAGTVIQTSSYDGIHLEAEAHQKLGEAVAEKVKGILS